MGLQAPPLPCPASQNRPTLHFGGLESLKSTLQKFQRALSQGPRADVVVLQVHVQLPELREPAEGAGQRAGSFRAFLGANNAFRKVRRSAPIPRGGGGGGGGDRAADDV